MCEKKKNKLKPTSKSSTIKGKVNYWIIRLQSQATVMNIATKEITEAINNIVPAINELIQSYESEITRLKTQLKDGKPTTKSEKDVS